jgi:hypothetical protein
MATTTMGAARNVETAGPIAPGAWLGLGIGADGVARGVRDIVDLAA